MSHIFLSSVSWSDLGVRQRSFLPPHHTSSGRDSQPRGRLYLQGLGEESRGTCSRFVILQVETPDESESRLKAISLLFFFWLFIAPLD